jgi:sigma-B regulation protein RsbU (phosphoserine phosphatase)
MNPSPNHLPAAQDQNPGGDRILLALASALADSPAHASLVLDASGRVLLAGPGSAGFFGLQEPPGQGTKAAELMPEAVRERFQALWRGVLEDGAHRTTLLRMGERGGLPLVAAASFFPVPQDGGQGPDVGFIAWDVSAEQEEIEKLRRGALDVIRLNLELRSQSSARQVAMQALEELSGRLKSVLEAASRVVIVATSPSGVINMFNPGAVNLLGYAPTEMEGIQTPLAFLDEDELAGRGRVLNVAEGGREAGLGVLMALARSGRRDFGEWTLVRKDGTRFAAELALSTIEGPSGVEGYLLVGVDVSGRKRAEAATAEREARLRAILDGAADGIITVDEAGRIETINRAAESLFGYQPGELTASLLLEKIAPGALKAGRSRRNGQVREIVGVRRDGSRFPMEMTISVVELPTKRLRTVIIRDISSRRKAEEAQREFTQRLAQQQAAMESDLKAAAEIQKSLLPKDLIPDLRFEAKWLFEPSAAIGGDIFNILSLDQDCIAAYMLDVSGHGAPSALVAAAAAQALQFHSRPQRSSSLACSNQAHGLDPERILAALDMEFPLERFGRYFSMVYATLNLVSGELRYANAGHPPPLLVRATGQVEELHAGGTVIGLGGLLPFTGETLRLAPGDMLVLYTDGLTEFEDGQGAYFGVKRLKKLLATLAGRGAGQVLKGLDQEIKTFGGGARPKDDLTVLVVTLPHDPHEEER